MKRDEATLAGLVAFLSASASVREKLHIETAYEPAKNLVGEIRIGDDCAAIPDGDGWLLFAAEGMLPAFVGDDPWFAGYSAVMVNLSDVAAMGGRPLAVVDVLWTPGLHQAGTIWEGMSAASRAYGVPIVGGHTTVTDKGAAFLAAAVLGKARNLMTSFDAQPGDDLLYAVDLRGAWRSDKPFWNASVNTPPERLRADLEILPELAERGWCRAAKDISNGGIVGTLGMLLNCSSVGAELLLDRLPRPECVGLNRWFISFPSFGYFLSVSPEYSARVVGQFSKRDIACGIVGRITSERSLFLAYGGARALFPLSGASDPHAKSQ
jgi:AIR synthase-related protein